MFSNHEQLKRKTAGGIHRGEFIKHLLEEYYTTTDIEAQEQITANLANFAYDPINWDYLGVQEPLGLFVELLAKPNEKLQLHGIAAICNICHNTYALKFLTQSKNLHPIVQLFLATQQSEILLDCMTFFYQTLSTSASLKSNHLITTPEILKRIIGLQQNSTDRRIKNITTLFLADFGQSTVNVGSTITEKCLQE